MTNSPPPNAARPNFDGPASDAPSTEAPIAGAPHTGRVGRLRSRPRRVYAVIGLATVAWLMLQLAAGIRQNDHTYPVTGYAMFSYPSDGVDVRLELVGTSAGRWNLDIEAADLGLTELQLRAYLARNAGAAATTAAPDASRRLEELAAVWSDRQGGTLEGITLWRVERSLDDGTPRAQEVSSWRR